VPRDEDLRAELLTFALDAGAPESAERLWAVLDDYEAWPGRRLVGDDGAHAAWLIAQLGDTDLQRRALGHLEAAVDCGDAEPAHYACLLDRIRMAEGRPQVFGTQFVAGTDGDVTPWPIEDPGGVDERRKTAGLEPLATQRTTMETQYRARPL
jgi:hypothetical protein